MKKVSLKVSKREKAGKGASRAIRREGQIPAVIYGEKKEPVKISVDPSDMLSIMNQKGLFTKQFEISVDGDDPELTMCNDIQLHPVKDTVLHIDFMRINQNKEIHLEIPVEIIGRETCKGIKEGGVLNIVRRVIEVICKVKAIPEHLTIDITDLEVGDSYHVQEMQLPEGVRLVDEEEDYTILTIAAPTIITDDDEADEETEEGEEGEEGSDESGEDKEGGAEKSDTENQKDKEN